MGWKETDKRLIRRGELILDIGSLKNNEEELKNMNKYKRGPHFKLANSCARGDYSGLSKRILCLESIVT